MPRDSQNLDDVELEEKKKDATLHPWMKFEIMDLRSLGKGDVAREGEDLMEKEEAVLWVDDNCDEGLPARKEADRNRDGQHQEQGK